jgi:hypothetical protein
MTYNGWANYETWAVNQRFASVFTAMDVGYQVTPAELRETVRETFIMSKITPLEREFITMAMSRVDWEHLAESYKSECFLIDEY